MACAMSLVQISYTGLMPWGPVATSVFLRWRVDSVPMTLAGRASTEKPSGVRSSPLYRRVASSRSAALDGAAVVTAGAGGVTLAGWLLADEDEDEGEAAAPPPPPQALSSSTRASIP